MITGSFNRLRGMLSTIRFLGKKLDGHEENGYLCQSSKLNPSGRHTGGPLQQRTLRIKSNLRFFILPNCAFICTSTDSDLGDHNIMLRILSEP